MADYSKYEQMRDAGATPQDVYQMVKADHHTPIDSIKILRRVFGLTLVEAKEIIVIGDGLVLSLDDHQAGLAPALEKAVVMIEKETTLQSNYAIRLATTDDIPTIVRHRWLMFEDMNLRSFLETPNVGEAFTEWVQPRINSGEYVGFLAIDGDGAVVGGAGVWLIQWIPQVPDLSTRRAYVMNVFVEAAHRRQGLARLLVTTLLDWCREQGIYHVVLHASDKGRPLYESLGFQTTNEMRINLL
jgi:GNAT superfamily N-acetyltransferase